MSDEKEPTKPMPTKSAVDDIGLFARMLYPDAETVSMILAMDMLDAEEELERKWRANQ